MNIQNTPQLYYSAAFASDIVDARENLNLLLLKFLGTTANIFLKKKGWNICTIIADIPESEERIELHIQN